MRVVVKIGSNILADSKEGLNLRRMRSLSANIAAVHGMGHEVVLVSSGAVAAGMKRLGLRTRPRDIKLKQAAAAVGQPALIWHYEKCFSEHRKKVAQVLLTRDGLSDRTMYINSKNTILTLLAHGVIPIINENDTVATDEIRFGDNDHLAALVASLLEADRLIILSDVDGLYSEDPRRDPGAKLVRSVTEVTDDMLKRAGDSSSDIGTGGMYSKLLAAEKAMRSGVTVNIINGRKPRILPSLVGGKAHGTELRPREGGLSARKGWIAFGIRSKGRIGIDGGAATALTRRQKSLLPSGIVYVEGSFQVGDAVYCVDQGGDRVAKGLTNYSSEELLKIMGRKTTEIEKTLGYKYSDEVIHRDNMVVIE
jgi:glutamate 5-kinase